MDTYRVRSYGTRTASLRSDRCLASRVVIGLTGKLVPVLLLLATAASSGCVSETSEGFSIYLLAQDTPVSQMPVISHLELADKPIISTNDVISYTKETHELKLTPDAYRRVVELDIPVAGRVFTVSVNLHPIYWGAFWTPVSSISFDGVVIVRPLESAEHVVRIQLGYPTATAFTGRDPRSEQEILNALEQAGKLR